MVETLRQILKIIPASSTNPLFTYLRLDFGEKVRASGTDGVVDASLDLEGFPATGQGSVFVPAKVLRDLLKELSAPSFSLEEEGLLVQEGKLQAKILVARDLGGLTLREPPLAAESVRVSKELLGRAIDAVSYAASREEYRGVFRGIQLEFHPEGWGRAVATDGYRLAFADFPLLSAPSALVVRVVSGLGAALSLLAALPDEELEIRHNDGTLWFLVRGGYLAQSLLEGTFPDYSRVVPKEFPLRIIFRPKEALSVFRRLAILASKDHRRIDFRPGGALGGVVLEVESDYGRGADLLEAQVEGAPFDLAFNLDYLMDALEPLRGEEEVALELSGPQTPAVLRPADPQAQGLSYTAVVVPLRV